VVQTFELANGSERVYISHSTETMSSLNKWLGLGNLTADPQRESMGAEQVATFVLAISERFGKDADHTKSTTFVRVVARGNLAESVMTYLTKSRQVLVEGRLHIQRVGDGDQKYHNASIMAENIQFLGGASGEERRAGR
jgi:single-strand DNA-binding protein